MWKCAKLGHVSGFMDHAISKKKQQKLSSLTFDLSIQSLYAGRRDAGPLPSREPLGTPLQRYDWLVSIALSISTYKVIGSERCGTATYSSSSSPIAVETSPQPRPLLHLIQKTSEIRNPVHWIWKPRLPTRPPRLYTIRKMASQPRRRASG